MIPRGVRRFVLDEVVLGANVALVPELRGRDWLGVLLGRMGREGKEREEARRREWTRKGERSVWMAVAVLRARCRVEVEIDLAYQIVRRRKPMELVAGNGSVSGAGVSGGGGYDERMLRGVGEKRKRRKGDGGIG